jgi:transposase
MREKSTTATSPSERLVKTIRRATRKHYSAEEKIRIVLDGLRGESSIAELCRREGIAEGLYYSWSKEFLEAGKRRLAGDTARAATSSDVTDLRREARALKEVVAEQALELRLLKKRMARPVGKSEVRMARSVRINVSGLGVPPGQDGDPRDPGLINMTAARGHFFHQASEPQGRLSGHLFCTSHRPHRRPAGADRAREPGVRRKAGRVGKAGIAADEFPPVSRPALLGAAHIEEGDP